MQLAAGIRVKEGHSHQTVEADIDNFEVGEPLQRAEVGHLVVAEIDDLQVGRVLERVVEKLDAVVGQVKSPEGVPDEGGGAVVATALDDHVSNCLNAPHADQLLQVRSKLLQPDHLK